METLKLLREYFPTAVFTGKCLVFISEDWRVELTEHKDSDFTKADIEPSIIRIRIFKKALNGEMEDGISYIKRFRNRIPDNLFTKHPLMKVVRRITNAYLKQNEKYIDEVIDNIEDLNYTGAELLVIKEALILSLVALMMSYKLNIPESSFERDSLIELTTQIDFSRLQEF